MWLPTFPTYVQMGIADASATKWVTMPVQQCDNASATMATTPAQQRQQCQRPLLCWPLCHCCDGAIAIVAQAPLPLLQWRCCPCCTGIVAVILLMLLSLLCWCHHIVVLASSPTLLRWHCCRLCNGAIPVPQVSSPLLCWCCLPCCAGIVAIIALVLWPSMHWHCCRHLAMLASMPLLHLRCCNSCNDAVAIVVLAVIF
jgi:hypothetical protein